MLRDAEDAPAQLFQPKVNLAVTFAVARDLGFPKLFVSLRSPVTLGTTVPEASIHEDDQPLLSEGEVGFPGEHQMPPPSGYSLLLEELNQHPFRPFVTLPSDQGHHLGSLLLGEDVWHRTSK